jgi:hypothetical protein
LLRCGAVAQQKKMKKARCGAVAQKNKIKEEGLLRWSATKKKRRRLAAL